MTTGLCCRIVPKSICLSENDRGANLFCFEHPHSTDDTTDWRYRRGVPVHVLANILNNMRMFESGQSTIHGVTPLTTPLTGVTVVGPPYTYQNMCSIQFSRRSMGHIAEALRSLGPRVGQSLEVVSADEERAGVIVDFKIEQPDTEDGELGFLIFEACYKPRTSEHARTTTCPSLV